MMRVLMEQGIGSGWWGRRIAAPGKLDASDSEAFGLHVTGAKGIGFRAPATRPQSRFRSKRPRYSPLAPGSPNHPDPDAETEVRMALLHLLRRPAVGLRDRHLREGVIGFADLARAHAFDGSAQGHQRAFRVIHAFHVAGHHRDEAAERGFLEARTL